MLEKDQRTVHGKTLAYLLDQCKLSTVNDLTPHIIKKTLKFESVPPELDWQVSLAKELLNTRRGELVIAGFTKEETDLMLNYVCTG